MHEHDRQLADIVARLAAAERSLAARRKWPARRRARRRLLPAVALALLLGLVPAALVAANPVFSDLTTAGEVHRADIQAIGDAGITTGFDDPASDDPNVRLYDPKGLVTREQMASFLA